MKCPRCQAARGAARRLGLRVSPAFGASSVHDRRWLVDSLAELGRFADAAEYEAEAIRLAEPTNNAFAIGMAHLGTLHLLKGDWAKARSRLERGIAVYRTGDLMRFWLEQAEAES